MNSKSAKKRPFEEAWWIEIEADIRNLCPIIERVASELHIGGSILEVRRAESRSQASFVWLDIFIEPQGRSADRAPIGVFTLESLGSNRTILRVPPRSEWGRGGLSRYERKMMRQYSELTARALDYSFMALIEGLDTTLRGYDVKATRLKRVWRRLKAILEIWSKVKP